MSWTRLPPRPGSMGRSRRKGAGCRPAWTKWPALSPWICGGPIFPSARSRFLAPATSRSASAWPGHDTLSALAAGCPVLVKAHPAHPRLGVRLGQVVAASLAESGAPAGAFGLLVGFDAGRALVDAPEVRAVAFTGSQAGGMALVQRASKRPQPIPVFAEMGTVNPVVLTPAAARGDLAAFTEAFVGSFTLGQGQFCTKPGLLLAPRGAGAADAVVAALASAAPRLAAHRRHGHVIRSWSAVPSRCGRTPGRPGRPAYFRVCCCANGSRCRHQRSPAGLTAPRGVLRPSRAGR